ncbi:hypothetical protein [Streptomyces sp. NPDC001315]|uniref:hypothetical protein n=1 Tax=Streptomyces sp. NPDC001315 TaxID=3364562 RepID=UPI003678E749
MSDRPGPCGVLTARQQFRTQSAHFAADSDPAARDPQPGRRPGDAADRVDSPVLLLAGSENGLWLDSQKLCRDVLAHRQPQLDVTYTEIPGHGHLDTFLGRGAALDVFGYILDFLGVGGDGRRDGRLPYRTVTGQ